MARAIDFDRKGKWMVIMLFHQNKRILTRSFGPFDSESKAYTAKRSIQRHINKDVKEFFMSQEEADRITLHICQHWDIKEPEVKPRTVAEKKAFEEAFDARIVRDRKEKETSSK